MTDIWFTSDTHFGHTNVIDSCNRPFTSVEDMNEGLIQRWNERVRDGDTVWHLGDVAFCDPRPSVARLNGEKHLILGNHDERWKKKLAEVFRTVRDVHRLRAGTERIWLSHYPHRAWKNSHRGEWHCFGHSHGDLPDQGRSTDVGVDCWDYGPVHIDELRKRFADRPVTNHHGD